MRRLAVLLVIAVSIGAFGPTALAKKKPLPLEMKICGETIDHSFRLANDMTCPAHGLIVPYEGITVDLNGHTIKGDGDGSDIGVFLGAGDGGRPTVKNGVIRQFGSGIMSGYLAIGFAVKNVVVELNSGNGILTGGSAIVTNCVVTHNDNIGIIVDDHSTVSNSTVTANRVGITSDRDGITITGNSITGNADAGVLIGDGTGDLIKKNVIEGNGHGGPGGPGLKLDTDTSLNRVVKNRISGNSTDGYEDDGTSNTAIENVARGNGFHQGLSNGISTGIDGSGATTPRGHDNISFGNDASDQCVPDALCEPA